MGRRILIAIGRSIGGLNSNPVSLMLVQAECLQLLLRPPPGEGLAARAGREAWLMADLDATEIYNVSDLYLVVKTI
jgi:hypothetical protein